MTKNNVTILIDDDPLFVNLVKKMMMKICFSNSYIVYNNGKEAIDGYEKLLKANDFDSKIILLDLNMPIMDGWQFLDKFCKLDNTKCTKVYIISSSIDPYDIDKAKTYKCIEQFISKPLSIDKLKLIADYY